MNLFKRTLFSLITLVCGSAQAMHYNPNLQGAMAARPFLAENIQVLSENLIITIDPGFEYASFDQSFQIKTFDSGNQIPFLLYTGDLLDSLTVYVDGQKVVVKEINEVDNIRKSRFVGFAYQFENEPNLEDSISWVEIMGAENRIESIPAERMSFFEANLSEGNHTIRITFSAPKAFKGDDWVGHSSFSYSLSPSQYWKSFGSLNLTIDASGFDSPITTNLRKPESGSLSGRAKWSLTSMETEVVSIDFTPEIKGTAQTLIAIGPFWMAQILGFFLVLTHLYFMYRWKRMHSKYRFSWYWLVGVVLTPLLYFGGWELCYEWIEYLLGDLSTGYRGDGAFLLFLAIIVTPLYMGFTALVDYIMESKVKQKEV